MSHSGNQPLPTKEAALFRQVVKLYETKQYKKAIKAADQILKKFPEHGETLAMKGLTYNYMDRKEDAYDLVRKGLKADLKSHICWHVYGLLYRSDNNYKEAAKCYLNALRQDKDNLQILRDLAMLQVQMRDIPGFVETRYQLLRCKPSNRTHWVSFAVAHHLDQNYDVAVQVLSAYEGILEEGASASGEVYERSELLLYKAQVLQEGGKADEALALLHEERARIKDRLGLMTAEAQLLLALGRGPEAAELYRRLLTLNPDDYDHHAALQTALGLRPASAAARSGGGGGGGATPGATWVGSGGGGGGLAGADLVPEQREGLISLYQDLQAAYPSSSACARIPLDFLEGDAFVEAAEAYVRPFLVKGIPSLFSALKPLYGDADKAQALGALFARLLAAVDASGKLPPAAGQPPLSAASAPPAEPAGASVAGSSDGSGAAAAAAAAPAAAASNGVAAEGGESERVWLQHYLSQHWDRLGDTAAALAAAEAALAEAPLVVELHSAKAKVLQHAGDLQGTAACAEHARALDLSDRYANSMSVKALFLAGRTEAAERTAMMFTRDGDSGNNLTDMQHMWYECCAGRAYHSLGQHGKALKKFTTVVKHFADFVEDQFDFHSYCVRKMTLRAYVALLRLEDRLYAHATYGKAALGAVQCYLELHDAAAAAPAAAADDEAALAGLSPAERKKALLARKKDAKRKDKEAKEKEAAAERARAEAEARERSGREASSSGGGAGGTSGGGAGGTSSGGGAAKRKAPVRVVDPDPDGAKLAATEDPLGEATKLVVMLKEHAWASVDTHLAAYEVYSRKGRALLALGAVQRARALAGAADARVHSVLTRFCQQMEQQPPAQPIVRQVVQQALPQLLDGLSLEQYAQRYASQHAASSLPQRCAAANALLRVGGAAAKPAAVQLLLSGAPAGEGATAVPAGGRPGGLHAECVAAHKLLLTGPLADADAAQRWAEACRCVFLWSEYFGGERAMSAAAAAGAGPANGAAEAVGRLALA